MKLFATTYITLVKQAHKLYFSDPEKAQELFKKAEAILQENHELVLKN